MAYTSPSLIVIHPDDTVAVAIEEIAAGECVTAGDLNLTTRSTIPKGHKVALRDHQTDDSVIKYGHSIGRITEPVETGGHVHSHNMATALGSGESYQYNPTVKEPPRAIPAETFQGYARPWGETGTRNEIWVLNTVGCVNRAAMSVAKAGNEIIAERGLDNVDGVHAFSHPFGCSQLGEDLDQTRDILRALAMHPNAGGVVIMGLGCENNRLDQLLEGIPPARRARIVSFNAQEVSDEEESGREAIETLLEVMKDDRRTPRPASALRLGMKCGGSDAFSGVSANPVVGRMTDYLTDRGGMVFLTEVPEMFGAEQQLMNRAVNQDVYGRIVSMIEEFKNYFISHDQPIYENPSPGNKDGGLTTLEEKSLGAVQKGGKAEVTDVLGYAEKGARSGLNLINAPGNDAVSSTALTAAGATILLFTTGRGTPLGFPVPTLKIASNSGLAARKPGWIDFNAGALVDGEREMEALAADLWATILRVASGELTRNEENDYREIAIWKRGVTL
jgi:altronate hydrolase